MSDPAPTRLLVVDDEAALREPLADYLSRQGFVVSQAASAAQARTLLRDETPDLVLLDIMMPGEDGLSLCRHLVEARAIPTIFLTARGEATDRIVGLEIGADDFLGKPFEPRELLARVRAVLRRTKPRPLPSSPGSSAGDESVYEFDGLKLSVDRRTLHDRGGNPVELTNAEFGLLRALVEHPNRVLSRDQLLDLTHGERTSAFDRSVDVQVARLRKKIERASAEQQVIKTVRGAGYILAAKVRRGAPAPR